MSKKCTRCGKIFDDNMMYCSGCGNRLEMMVIPKKPRNNKPAIFQNTKLVYVIAAVAGALLVSQLDVHFLARLIGSLAAGVIFGLVPFFVARSRGKEKLGLIALLVTVVGSFIAGMYLSIPSMIVFTVLALKRN